MKNIILLIFCFVSHCSLYANPDLSVGDYGGFYDSCNEKPETTRKLMEVQEVIMMEKNRMIWETE